MKNRYDYTEQRWRSLQRTSQKHGVAEDIDGNRFPLANFEPTAEIDYEAIDDDWKLLGAIACHSQTAEDFGDARDALTHLPQDLRLQLWRSFPAEVKAGLKVANTQRKAA